MDPTTAVLLAGAGFYGVHALRKLGGRPGASRLLLGVPTTLRQATAPLHSAIRNARGSAFKPQAILRHKPGRQVLRRTRG